MIQFSLAPGIYAAKFNNSIIILNTLNDEYLSLVDDAAEYFNLILQESFVRDKATFRPVSTSHNPKNFSLWIQEFREAGFITQYTNKTYRRNSIVSPRRPGGLTEYQWDTKKQWHPYRHTSKLLMLQATFQLFRIHRIIKRKGMQGLLREIKKYKANQKIDAPSEKMIQELIAAVDAASILYPKKTLCLAWAATFTTLALKKNWPCTFLIGVQAHPFYAHAWAEINGRVINDDPIIQDVLSIILSEPRD